MSETQEQFLTHVSSNLKGGVNCALGRRTLIVGKNEAGKTALVNAIEYALTLACSQIFGRDIAKDAGLVALLAPKGEQPWAQVQLSGGGRVRATASSAKGKGAKKAAQHFYDGAGVEQPNLPFDPAKVFPMRELESAIAGKDETQRGFFLHYATGKLSDKDVIGKIPKALHERVRQLSNGIAPELAPTDKLLEMQEKAEGKVREARAQVRASEKHEQEVASGLAPQPLEADLTALKAAVEAARAEEARLLQLKGQLAAAANAPTLISQQNVMRASAERARDTAIAQMNEINAAVNTLPPKPVPDDLPRAETIAVMTWHASHGEQHCNVCGSAAHPATFATRLELAKRMSHDRLAADQNWAELERKFKAAQENHTMALKEIAQYDANVTIYQQQAANVSGQANEVEVHLHAAGVARATADTALQKARELVALWQGATKARELGSQSKAELDEWVRLVDACKEAVKGLFDAGQDRIAQWVQMRLPPSDRFMFKLREGQKAVCKFGLERDGRLDVALSGGKWAQLMGALADVCKSEGLAIIVPEDRGFDPDTLAALLTGYSACTSQVIVQSTTRPAFVPEGWTVIDADLGQHRIGAIMDVATAPTFELSMES